VEVIKAVPAWHKRDQARVTEFATGLDQLVQKDASQAIAGYRRRIRPRQVDPGLINLRALPLREAKIHPDPQHRRRGSVGLTGHLDQNAAQFAAAHQYIVWPLQGMPFETELRQSLGDHHTGDQAESAKFGHRQFEAVITGNIGNVMNELGDHRVALQYFEDAINILRKIGFRVLEGYFLGQSGRAYAHLGMYDQAIEYLDQATKVFKETGNTTMEAVYLDALGSIFCDTGEYEKASYYSRTAQMILKDRGFKRHYFTNTLNRAHIYMAVEDMENAKASIDASMAIAEEIGSVGLKCRTLISLCEWSFLNGNIETAKRALIQLRKAVEKVRSSYIVNMNTFLWGRYYSLLPNYHDAHTYLEKALHDYLELEERLMIGKVQYYLGDLYIIQKNQKLGREYIQKALEVFADIGARKWMGKAEDLMGALR